MDGDLTVRSSVVGAVMWMMAIVSSDASRPTFSLSYLTSSPSTSLS